MAPHGAPMCTVASAQSGAQVWHNSNIVYVVRLCGNERRYTSLPDTTVTISSSSVAVMNRRKTLKPSSHRSFAHGQLRERCVTC